MPQAFEAMRAQGPAPRDGGIRQAAPGVQRWPRISILHGTGDQTVDVGNADRLLTQWLDVHGLPARPDSDLADGRRRHRTWASDAGEVRVDDHRIEALRHGTPLDPAGDPLGAAGPFMLDVGFSSTVWLIEVWGLGGGRERRTLPHAATGSDAAATQRAFVPPRPASAGRVQAMIETALRRPELLP